MYLADLLTIRRTWPAYRRSSPACGFEFAGLPIGLQLDSLRARKKRACLQVAHH